MRKFVFFSFFLLFSLFSFPLSFSSFFFVKLTIGLFFTSSFSLSFFSFFSSLSTLVEWCYRRFYSLLFHFCSFFSFLLLLVLLSLPPAEAGRLLAVTVDCSSFIATIKAARRHPAVTVQPGWIWYTGATSDQAFLHGTWSILLAGLRLNGIDDEME